MFKFVLVLQGILFGSKIGIPIFTQTSFSEIIFGTIIPAFVSTGNSFLLIIFLS